LSIAEQSIVGNPVRSRRANLTPDEQRDIVRLYSDENASPAELRTRFGIGDSTLYRLLQKQGVTLRGRSDSAPHGRQAEGSVAAGQGPSRRGGPRSGSGKAPLTLRAGHRSTNGVPFQFRVTYSAVQTLQATDIRDALHQSETLGATDVLEIERQI